MTPMIDDKQRQLYHSVLQEWVLTIPLMQQTVLIAATRGPDGFNKYHPAKPILRWYRRCLLRDAMNGSVLRTPHAKGGGSFAGPSCELQSMVDGTSMVTFPDWQSAMNPKVDEFMQSMDEFHLHAWLHMLHAFQIVGYGHDAEEIAGWWEWLYRRMVSAMHLMPERKEDLYRRLGDTYAGWAARSDPAIDKGGI